MGLLLSNSFDLDITKFNFLIVSVYYLMIVCFDIIMGIKLPDSVVESIAESSSTEYTDDDMNRDATDKEEDAICGDLGELVANRYFNRQGYNISESRTPKTDLLLNGVPVEVKSRKTWNFSEPDLLIRTKFDLASDIYVQVDLFTEDNARLKSDASNFSHAEFAGFVPKETVENDGEPFNQNYSAKKNSTLIVDRSDLLDISRINEYL